MYKGGCYDKTGDLGQVICKTPGDTPGVCEACADGYFTVSGATDSKDSCTKCGDENCATCTVGTTANKCTKCAEGYFVGAGGSEGPCISCSSTSAGSGGWTGVTGCAKCTKPATSATPAICTECNTELYLKTETSGTSCVASNECTGGFFPMTDTADSNRKKCLTCSDGINCVADCAECTAPAQGKTKPACTKCTTSNYLKTASDGATTCVAKDACKDGFFPKEDSSNGNKCLSCGDAANGVPNCAKCTLPPGATKPTCSECGSGYKLEGGACVSTGANKSALSTGAAVVVGGLVGFLCW